jgi:GT2 family glycosyltransferase
MKLEHVWSKVNVVCVTFNNADTIEPLLKNLSEQGDLISEIVIHDNGSVDDTAQKSLAWLENGPGRKLTLIRSSNVGFGAGVFGACQALSDPTLPTLCLNPDAILSPGTLGRMIETLNGDLTIGIVTAPLVRADGELDTASVRKLPRFGPSVAYSVLGKIVPKRLRYNGATLADLEDGSRGTPTAKAFFIEATTGALMLVNPYFRTAAQPIFDLSYWMYGEDLQLCKDAAEEGFRVAIIDWPASLHLKGVSSGWPRGKRSNEAFHEALYLYYSKNMSRGPIDRFAAKLAIRTKYAISQTAGGLARQVKTITRS